MNYRFPDPPNLSSLSPADAQAFRRWAAELNRTLNLMASQMGAANSTPFWIVTGLPYPERNLNSSSTTSDVRAALATLVVDLQGKGTIA